MISKYKLSKPFDYDNDVMYANEEPIQFWDDNARAVHWDKQYDSVYSGNELKPDWFKGGLLNTCYNVLDRNVNQNKDRIALIYECPYLKRSTKITYLELFESVCKFSAVLVSLGISKGDRVLIYMPTSIQACIAMLSCARIGATHIVVYGGHNEFNLMGRIESCKPKAIILSNYGFSNNEIVPYTPNIIKALELSNHQPNHIITYNRDDHFDKQFISSIPPIPSSLDWNQLINNESIQPNYQYTPVESSHPLYIIYTSGTTGKPKGIVRDTAGHLVGCLYYNSILCPTPHPVLLGNSNVGWVSFHCMFYNTLAVSGTVIMYEGVATLLNQETEFWALIEKYGVNYFFTSPSSIRTIMKYDPLGESILKYNLSSLLQIWVGGESSFESGLNFIRNVVGKDIYNIMGQSESSIPLIISFKGAVKKNMIGIQPPFVHFKILSEDGQELKPNQTGELVIKLPLPPGFTTGLYNNDEGYYNNYFSKFKGYYQTGDLGFKDEDGYISISARSDDVLIVSKMKFKGTLIEDAILYHPKVLESSCIGLYDDICGEVPIAFVVLKDNSKHNYNFNSLKNEINQLVEEKNGYFARLKKLIIVERLPKTKNGKNTKSILKKVINDKDFVIPDITEYPELYNEILNNFNNQKDQ